MLFIIRKSTTNLLIRNILALVLEPVNSYIAVHCLRNAKIWSSDSRLHCQHLCSFPNIESKLHFDMITHI